MQKARTASQYRVNIHIYRENIVQQTDMGLVLFVVFQEFIDLVAIKAQLGKKMILAWVRESISLWADLAFRIDQVFDRLADIFQNTALGK